MELSPSAMDSAAPQELAARCESPGEPMLNHRRIVPTVALLAVACTHNPAPNPGAHMWQDTTFAFTENLPGADRTIEGTVRVIGVDAVVDAQPGPCHKDTSRTLGYVTVLCDDVYYYVDLTGSVVRVNYRTTKSVVEMKNTCVRYDTN